MDLFFFVIFRSALTYNMIGHMKTISILLGGFILFHEYLNIKQFMGILLTLFGLFSYTLVRMREQNQLPCTRWNINPTSNNIV